MSTPNKKWVLGEKVKATDLNGQFEGHKISEIAGEPIAGATLPVPVCLLNDIFQKEYRQSFNFGNITANTQRSVKVVTRTEITSNTLKMIMDSVGLPTGNLTIEIQSDSAGSPSGTAITNGISNVVAMSSIATTFEETTFTFASTFTIVADTTYWIVLKRSDAINSSDYIRVLGINNDYASFVGKKYDATSWSTGELMYIEMVAATGSSLTVWQSDSNVIGLHWFDGFAITTAVSIGDSIDIQTNGIVSGFSNLQLKKYYVQDAVGTIGDTVGTYETGVGEAISDTELLIKKYENEYIGSTASNETVANLFGISGYYIAISGAKMWAVSQSFTGDPASSSTYGFARMSGGLTSVKELGSDLNSTNVVSSIASVSGGYRINYNASSSTQNSNWSGSGTVYFYR